MSQLNFFLLFDNHKLMDQLLNEPILDLISLIEDNLQRQDLLSLFANYVA